MQNNREIGQIGERIALSFLEDQGYILQASNWRSGRAEIDLIMQKDQMLVFVEVKTRSSDYFGKPEEFVDIKKEKLMIDAAYNYMEEYDYDWEIRFDIIAVQLEGEKAHLVRHFEDAFF